MASTAAVTLRANARVFLVLFQSSYGDASLTEARQHILQHKAAQGPRKHTSPQLPCASTSSSLAGNMAERGGHQHPCTSIALSLAGKMGERGGTLRAKKTEAPRNSGGSPTALEECAWGVRLQGASRSSVTRRSSGMSLAVGILYVPACKQRVLNDVFTELQQHSQKPPCRSITQTLHLL